MKKVQTPKLQQAIEKLVQLIPDLDPTKLQTGNVEPHTIYRALERAGHRWDGNTWAVPMRPWMEQYTKPSPPAPLLKGEGRKAPKPQKTEEKKED